MIGTFLLLLLESRKKEVDSGFEKAAKRFGNGDEDFSFSVSGSG